MSDVITVSQNPINMDHIYQSLSDPEFGAQLVFVGTVRRVNEGREVIAVHYDAFIPLAEGVLKELALEARELVGGSIKVMIVHRIGRVTLGETSTVIGVATKHRDESYRASRYIIEELKKRAPIWKEEIYADGERRWLDGSELKEPDLCGDPSRREVIENGNQQSVTHR